MKGAKSTSWVHIRVRKGQHFHISFLFPSSHPLHFCLTFCLSTALPTTWFFQCYGDLDQIDRNQGQTKEVKSMVNCVPRAQQRSAAGLQKMPDLCKDDLARRRLQARLAPSHEARCFVTASTITQADLETWERLKVSEKARCVHGLLGSPGRKMTKLWRHKMLIFPYHF